MNDTELHFRKLERMYLSAPINKDIYKGINIAVSHERTEITLPVVPGYFHAASAVHGSIYFKMLDDAAFFAVNSIIHDTFIYTVSMNIQLLRPVKAGVIRSVGELKFKSINLFIADAVLYDENNKVVGRGSGNFMRSRIRLAEEIGYK